MPTLSTSAKSSDAFIGVHPDAATILEQHKVAWLIPTDKAGDTPVLGVALDFQTYAALLATVARLSSAVSQPASKPGRIGFTQ